jgi:hypothetical protein
MSARQVAHAVVKNQVATNGIVLEARRALERNYAKNPYLARQLSVFDDRQLVTGYSGRWLVGFGVCRTRR